MTLNKDHMEEMNKLEELIKTVKERKSTKFIELIVASIVGVFASKLYDAIYSTPITNWEDSAERGFVFVIMLASITAFLFLCASWTDILRLIRNRGKKPS